MANDYYPQEITADERVLGFESLVLPAYGFPHETIHLSDARVVAKRLSPLEVLVKQLFDGEPWKTTNMLKWAAPLFANAVGLCAIYAATGDHKSRPQIARPTVGCGGETSAFPGVWMVAGFLGLPTDYKIGSASRRPSQQRSTSTVRDSGCTR